MKHKKAIFIFLLAISRVTMADTAIKLVCDVNENIRYFQDGRVENIKGQTTIEVYDGPTYLVFLTEERLNIDSVSTKLSPGIFYADNQSDSNKWAIHTERKSNGNNLETLFVIDRNTGRFSYNQVYGRIVSFEATGMCEKIDSNKRKF